VCCYCFGVRISFTSFYVKNRKRSLLHCPCRPQDPPKFLSNRYRVSFPEQSGRILKFTTHHHPVRELRASGVIPPVPLRLHGVDREDVFFYFFYSGSKSQVRNFHYNSRRYSVKIPVFSFTEFSLFLLESSQ